jgi:membrane fusion protein (multidrug efflux system)
VTSTDRIPAPPSCVDKLGIALICVALILALGCSRGTPATTAPPPPPEVRVMMVSSQTLANIVEVPGRLQAVRTAEVRGRVNGIVQRRLYLEGSDVRAGQPLFAIDPRELRAQLNAALATMARAQATAANARQVVTRYQGLVAQKAISQQENDAAVAQLRTAEADVAQSRAQVESAQLNLSYTTVTAPISGRAGRADVTEGALVSAASATLLTTVEQVDPIYANFSQSSSDLLAIRTEIASGALKVPAALRQVAARLVLEDGSVYGPVGHLNFGDLAIDPATGTSAIRAQFTNPNRVLLPGQFVRVRVEAGVRPRGLLVPQRAVTVAPQGASVMVVGAKDVVTNRPVTLGDLHGGSWIILSGLAPGDRVVTDGLQKVQPGKRVHIAADSTHSVALAPIVVRDTGTRASR